jgi:hypothetical protein
MHPLGELVKGLGNVHNTTTKYLINKRQTQQPMMNIPQNVRQNKLYIVR